MWCFLGRHTTTRRLRLKEIRFCGPPRIKERHLAHYRANSEETKMNKIGYVPRNSEKVLVAGCYDVFLVLSVDHDKQTADLIPLNHLSRIVDSVPLPSVRPFREEIPLETA